MSLIALDIDEVLLDCISRLNGLAKQLFKAIIIGELLGALFAVIVNVIEHTL